MSPARRIKGQLLDFPIDATTRLTFLSFSFILVGVPRFRRARFEADSACVSGGRLPSLLPDSPGGQPLEGQLVVFTGKLSSLGRRDARALVMRLGGVTADDVNARTTMLVVGSEGFGAVPGASDLVPGTTPDEGVSGFGRTVRDKRNNLKAAEALNAQ